MGAYDMDNIVNVYLSDHDQTGISRWLAALTHAFGDRFKVGATLHVQEPPASHVAYADTKAVLFVHSISPEKWRAKANEDIVKCHIVLVRSGGDYHPEAGNAKGNLHGCCWHPNTFTTFNAEGAQREVSQFVRQVRAGDPVKIVWELLLRPVSEPRFALRIFCEAWKFTEGHGSKTDGGVNVRAPMTALEWFQPFVVKPPELKDASEIADLMGGDEKSEAKTLLEAVFSKVAVDLGTEIDKFHSKVCVSSGKSKDFV